jgi:hypothetical protein
MTAFVNSATGGNWGTVAAWTNGTTWPQNSGDTVTLSGGSTITLDGNYSIASITSGDNTSYILNSSGTHSLTLSATNGITNTSTLAAGLIQVTAGSLTINGGGSGTVAVYQGNSTGTAVSQSGTGALTVSNPGGTCFANISTSSGKCLNGAGSGQVVITGTTAINQSGSSYYGTCVTLGSSYSTGSGSTITGDILNSSGGGTAVSGSGGVITYTGGTVNITGGSSISSIGIGFQVTSTLNITNATTTVMKTNAVGIPLFVYSNGVVNWTGAQTIGSGDSCYVIVGSNGILNLSTSTGHLAITNNGRFVINQICTSATITPNGGAGGNLSVTNTSASALFCCLNKDLSAYLTPYGGSSSVGPRFQGIPFACVA